MKLIKIDDNSCKLIENAQHFVNATTFDLFLIILLKSLMKRWFLVFLSNEIIDFMLRIIYLMISCQIWHADIKPINLRVLRAFFILRF